MSQHKEPINISVCDFDKPLNEKELIEFLWNEFPKFHDAIIAVIDYKYSYEKTYTRAITEVSAYFDTDGDKQLIYFDDWCEGHDDIKIIGLLFIDDGRGANDT